MCASRRNESQADKSHAESNERCAHMNDGGGWMECWESKKEFNEAERVVVEKQGVLSTLNFVVYLP